MVQIRFMVCFQSQPALHSLNFHFTKRFMGFFQDFELGQVFLGDDFGPPLLRGGTITNLAIIVAYICGSRDILFFGLDMAMPNGRKYANNSGGILRDIDKTTCFHSRS